MRMFFAAALAAFLTSNTATAQTTNFDGDSVYKSIQCDVGQLAKKTRKLKLPADTKAHIKYYAQTDQTVKISFSAKVGLAIKAILEGPSLEASHSRQVVNDDTIEDDFNLNDENTDACFKSRPPVGVYNCLSQKTLSLAHGHAACTTTTTVIGKLDASGKFMIWYFTFGPEAEYDVKITYTITVDVPPPKKG